ncbi:ABC transporter ATP-binding protein [Anaerosphaera multitolerans]|uniref:ABC transporter ATP-binding protein n=1 Tax=Anaerosphaera multitolerans TaxID=2487351 RepID=A0A437S6V6_9FIRM|nr:ABC transporter ATP-binding protein [Anaerosphaera multitolerans]RVU54742.1 ABC transporter ATP-binding protein [Anaerosphaera multitolerans]
MSDTVLTCENVGIRFGGLQAVKDLNLKINKGELLGLIGPNGAGKTTVFNMITGVYAPTEGDIILNGEKINGFKPHKIVESGIARTFQNIRLFGYLSVLDNVKIAMNKDMKYSILNGMFRTKGYWKEEFEVNSKAMEILKLFDLDNYKQYSANTLPYGQQRKLEIARAMATNPSLLLLDEPAAGMNPTETEELMNTIKFIRDKFGITILLIEHDMKLVLGICERLMVLNYGQVLAEGDPIEVINDEKVINAYLGSGGA